MNKVLVTGGMGFIGSHTVVELLTSGQEVVIADNLFNSKIETLDKIETITGTRPEFVEIDLVDKQKVKELFNTYKFSSVIHFASYKAVGESTQKPIAYYSNNINSALNVIDEMIQHNVKKFIFSSSATVYGDPVELPLMEDTQVGIGITNPYGWTKLMCEQILRDVCAADESVILLRYFNPVGSHESGIIGENPSGIPNNLMPFVMQTAHGIHKEVRVFGNDYDTPDGTGVRDY
ncbi:MAG: UDP-glucose 4-epimerase GalE, partial [Streptococcaceae bacterium]|nr:UDP-glucose 4-epimerase GalE [Streptococcaceae bacterium]